MTADSPTESPAHASGDALVYVVGMHRSGTSATAGALVELGLHTARGDDLLTATTSNERGHFESRSLLQLNNRLIRQCGGTWLAPPAFVRWSVAPDDEQRREASALVRSSLPLRPAVWKDPRLCTTLPFWRNVIASPCAAVFVFRRPGEVVGSLQRRSCLSATHASALWERCVRAAAANLDGLPTLAADYGRVVADPASWIGEATDFLARVGVVVPYSTTERAAHFLDPTLAHEHPVDDSSGMLPGLSALYDALAQLEGAHFPWRAPDLGGEPQWVGDVLTLAAELDIARLRQESITSSRAYKVMGMLRKVRATLSPR